MILSDREIRLAIERGLIGLTPTPPKESLLWSTTTLDLRLDEELRVWGPLASPTGTDVVDPIGPGFNSNQLVAQHTTPVDCTAGFILEPKAFVLGWTIERLRLPREARLGARVEGKSGLARIGIGIHVTAPTIHPGFGAIPSGSPIRLEIWNVGTLRVRLTKGMPICQLIFEEVHGIPETENMGQFRIQGPPTTS
ncbi:MAG: dCTP deaminase [Planctomycetia bacterium]|nr:dCTP deaminase [Planctomycetia bacterium]